MNIQIKKLNPSRLPDYMHFFDDIAFCDNPAWSLCYCCFYYLDDTDELVEDEPLEGIRNYMRTFAMDRIKAGELNGFLAYNGSEPVGWCNADIKTNYKRVMDNKEISYDPSKKVGSIVCFVIDPKHRRKGIASDLLKSACSSFKEQGYDYIEAYPAKHPHTSAENYHGPVHMYLKQGFEIISEFETFYIVRKNIVKI